MNAQEALDELAELKRQYQLDCAALRLGLYGKPWLLNPRLSERGEQYDEDCRRVLAGVGRGVTKYQIEQAVDDA